MKTLWTDTTVIARAPGWLSAPVGDELVMLDADHGVYVALSPTGARIWELIDTPRTLAAVRARLLAEYEVPAPQLESELDAFLTKLNAQGCLRLESDAGLS